VTSADPFTPRLSLFTGKGGVGKSTVAAAIAMEASRRGLRPLVVELGHRASMQAIFGVPRVGHDPIEVAPGVHATNIDLDRTLADYVREQVPVRALASRIARSRSLERFFEAAPAVAEVLTLHRIEQLLAEMGAKGQPRWHPVLVDFDATGHALMFLELPHVFHGLVPAGPLRALLDSFAALLSDRAHTRLHLVTIPGHLPVQETLELCARLEREHAVPLGTLFVNQVPPPPLPPRAEASIDAILTRVDPASPLGDDLALARRAAHAHHVRRAELARLDALRLPRIELPHLRGALDPRALAHLGRCAGGEP
jgi:anion-transporting  ArsA/GET3 family ATPase